MRRLRWIAPLLAISLVLACNAKPDPIPAEPLTWGDAEWPGAPIPQPGGNGNDDGGDGGDDEGNGDPSGGDPSSSGGVTSLGFVPDEDFGGSNQCDPFMQDCPEGEKCVAYASTGGALDANKCVPVNGDGLPGESCMYSGVVEATDDCNASSYCWDVADTTGTCAQFCDGTADNPLCPEGLDCLIAYDGSLNLCLADMDGGMPDMPDLEQPEDNIEPLEEPPEQLCPDVPQPVVLYMSNDDSNSQASPALARRLIHDGQIVTPDRVRIHEFLNYYTITTDYPVDQPAAIGMQMRRTNVETGEFTLLLTAKGQLLRDDKRPPMNLVFSLDTSGSMSGERLELVKSSMLALASELRSGDVISLVTWSSSQSIILQNHAVIGPNDPTLVAKIMAIKSGGSTNLHGGLATAYLLAKASYKPGGINRVILMSDGGANAGVVDINLIADAAAAEDGSGIYLVGVGVGPAGTYSDVLMDQLTDAGKGAYLFIDSPAEAQLQFTDRFLSNVSVAARNVSMRVTLPWYFAVKSFHGEEYSADPAEVEPQHLAPNDAMSFHQIISACDPESINANDLIQAHIEYLHPLTLQPMSDSIAMPIGLLVKADATSLYKADVVVAFAKSLIVIGAYWQNGMYQEARDVAVDMKAWLSGAAQSLGDAEVLEMATLMSEYAIMLGG